MATEIQKTVENKFNIGNHRIINNSTGRSSSTSSDKSTDSNRSRLSDSISSMASSRTSIVGNFSSISSYDSQKNYNDKLIFSGKVPLLRLNHVNLHLAYSIFQLLLSEAQSQIARPYWYLFADTHTTKKIITNLYPLKSIDDHLFADFFISTEKSDQNLKLSLDKEKKLIKQNFTKKKQISKFNNLYSTITNLDPKIFAQDLRKQHYRDFNKVNSQIILSYSTRKTYNFYLDSLLSQHQGLTNFATLSLLRQENQDPDNFSIFLFWTEVANEFLVLEDYFGAHSLYNAFTNLPKDYTASVLNKHAKLKSTLNLLAAKFETKEPINYDKEATLMIIPALLLDIQHLERQFALHIYNLKIKENPKSSLENIGKIAQNFELSFKFHKNQLLQLYKHQTNTIETYNTSLILDFKKHTKTTSGKNSIKFLLSLRKKSSNQNFIHTQPQQWLSSHFADWLKENNLNQYAFALAEMGIVDGPTLITANTHFLANNLDSHQKYLEPVFKNFNNWYNKKNITYNPVPTNIVSNPNDCYSWLIWLKNNNLDADINLLFQRKQDTFFKFFWAYYINKDNYNFWHGISSKKRYIKLIKSYAHFRRIKDNFADWDELDTESWLLVSGFDHYSTEIKDYLLSNIEKTSRFSANSIEAFKKYNITQNPQQKKPATSTWISIDYSILKTQIQLE